MPNSRNSYSFTPIPPPRPRLCSTYTPGCTCNRCVRYRKSYVEAIKNSLLDYRPLPPELKKSLSSGNIRIHHPRYPKLKIKNKMRPYG